MRQVQTYSFSGIDNFRDFGGGASDLGGRIRTGRLFRSAHHGAATDADLDAVAALDVQAVVDLRRTTERDHQPSRRWAGFSGRVIECDLGDRAEGPHIEFLRQGDLSDEGVERYLSGYYRQAPFEPRHVELFARTFEALDEIQGALLIHCTAGKDRTGLLAALIQRALGARMDDVMADFLETNPVMMTDARRARTASNLQAILGRAPSPAILQGFLGVTAGHLEAAFEAIEGRGGLERYLETLGAGPERLGRLRARLLV